jgi:hypothetical protein
MRLWLIAALLFWTLVALWGVQARLDRINQRLTMSNCLAEANGGVRCAEAAK